MYCSRDRTFYSGYSDDHDEDDEIDDSDDVSRPNTSNKNDRLRTALSAGVYENLVLVPVLHTFCTV